MNPLKAVLLGCALAAALPAAVHAQEYAVDRGSMILGGSAGFSRSTTTFGSSEHTVTHAHLSPSARYFVRPGLAIGGALALMHTRHNGEASTFYGVGPAASYFFGRGEQSLYPYLSGSLFYGRHDRADFGALDYGGSAGAVYMLSRSVGLDGSLFYRARRDTGSEGTPPRHSSFGVAVGFSAFTF